jgi:hypothetical protein
MAGTWAFGITAIIIVLGASAMVCPSFFIPKTGNGGVTGFASQATGTINIKPTGPSSCSVPLVKGWNFISMCAETGNTEIPYVLSSIEGKYKYVAEWDESADKFIVYSPNDPDPPFDSFDLHKSYFLFFIEDSGTLELAGPEFGDMDISLAKGKNTPTWPYHFTAEVSRYLETIEGDYKFLMKWRGGEHGFELYNPNMPNPPFTTISPGEGQFIMVTNPAGTLLQYDKSYLSS